jgi:hypothetical protein
MLLHHGKGRTSFSAQNDRIFGCFDAIEGSGELLDSGWKLSTCSEKLSTLLQLLQSSERTIETAPSSVSGVSFGQHPTGAARSRPDDPLSHSSTGNPLKRDDNNNFPVNEGSKGTSGHHPNEEPEQNAPIAHGHQLNSEPQDLSEIPQLIHDYLLVVKQQQQGKKLRQDLLRSMVANKVHDLSDNRYSVTTILDYYGRLNSDDARISALISSICSGETLVRGRNEGKTEDESQPGSKALEAPPNCLCSLVFERLRLNVRNGTSAYNADELMVQTVYDVHVDHPDIDPADIAAAFRDVQGSDEGLLLVNGLVRGSNSHADAYQREAGDVSK